MQSLSKTTLTSEVLAAIVRKHLGEPLESFTEMKDGYFNTAYCLQLNNGQKCVLKVAPPPEARVLTYEHGILQAEVEALRLVREHTGVPVPQVLAYDASGQLTASPFFVMAFVSGEPFNKVRAQWSVEDQAGIDRTVGGYVRAIGTITGTAFGCYAQPANQRPTWRAAFTVMLNNLLQDGRALQVELPVPYDDLFAQMEKHFEALDEVTTPRLVHWDLWDGNVFVDPVTQKVTGVIDFERAWWGDPLAEVCFRRMDSKAAVVQGYGEDVFATPNQKRRRILYNLYLYLIMIIEHYYRQYESDDLLKWATGLFVADWERLTAGKFA